jgi:hypothetical protein
MNEESLEYRLLKRAEIRRQIPGRKSVQEGKPDRIADLLEEAAHTIRDREQYIRALQQENKELRRDYNLYEPIPYWQNPNWKPPEIT